SRLPEPAPLPAQGDDLPDLFAAPAVELLDDLPMEPVPLLEEHEDRPYVDFGDDVTTRREQETAEDPAETPDVAWAAFDAWPLAGAALPPVGLDLWRAVAPADAWARPAAPAAQTPALPAAEPEPLTVAADVGAVRGVADVFTAADLLTGVTRVYDAG